MDNKNKKSLTELTFEQANQVKGGLVSGVIERRKKYESHTKAR